MLLLCTLAGGRRRCRRHSPLIPFLNPTGNILRSKASLDTFSTDHTSWTTLVLCWMVSSLARWGVPSWAASAYHVHPEHQPLHLDSKAFHFQPLLPDETHQDYPTCQPSLENAIWKIIKPPTPIASKASFDSTDSTADGHFKDAIC